MPQGQIVALGLIAGVTIFVGLPVGRLTGAGVGLRAFLSAIAVGILLFLFWDVVSAAVDGIEAALHEAVAGTGAWGDFALLTATGAAGLAVSLLGLVGYERWLAAHGAGSVGLGAFASPSDTSAASSFGSRPPTAHDAPRARASSP